MARRGTYRHRVKIIDPNKQLATSGQLIDNPATTDDDVPASVTAVSGGESVQGRTMNALATNLIKIHFREDITTAFSIEHEGRSLQIVRVYDPVGKRRELFVECKEKV